MVQYPGMFENIMSREAINSIETESESPAGSTAKTSLGTRHDGTSVNRVQIQRVPDLIAAAICRKNFSIR